MFKEECLNIKSRYSAARQLKNVIINKMTDDDNDLENVRRLVSLYDRLIEGVADSIKKVAEYGFYYIENNGIKQLRPIQELIYINDHSVFLLNFNQSEECQFLFDYYDGIKLLENDVPLYDLIEDPPGDLTPDFSVNNAFIPGKDLSYLMNSPLINAITHIDVLDLNLEIALAERDGVVLLNGHHLFDEENKPLSISHLTSHSKNKYWKLYCEGNNALKKLKNEGGEWKQIDTDSIIKTAFRILQCNKGSFSLLSPDMIEHLRHDENYVRRFISGKALLSIADISNESLLNVMYVIAEIYQDKRFNSQNANRLFELYSDVLREIIDRLKVPENFVDFNSINSISYLFKSVIIPSNTNHYDIDLIMNQLTAIYSIIDFQQHKDMLSINNLRSETALNFFKTILSFEVSISKNMLIGNFVLLYLISDNEDESTKLYFEWMFENQGLPLGRYVNLKSIEKISESLDKVINHELVSKVTSEQTINFVNGKTKSIGLKNIKESLLSLMESSSNGSLLELACYKAIGQIMLFEINQSASSFKSKSVIEFDDSFVNHNPIMIQIKLESYLMCREIPHDYKVWFKRAIDSGFDISGKSIISPEKRVIEMIDQHIKESQSRPQAKDFLYVVIEDHMMNESAVSNNLIADYDGVI